MDKNRLNKIIEALNKKEVNQPCPRCSSNNFSVVGESEITVAQTPAHTGLLGGLASLGQQQTMMPTIIVTCDNCGYISQHAQASLGLLPKAGLLGGLAGMSRFK